jgi:putative endonuclease
MTNKYHTVLYIGVTKDLKVRVYQHKHKTIEGFTKRYNCTKLVYYEEFNDINLAIQREKEIKKWRREKKNSLVNKINPEWRDLAEGFVA